jgi:hypothetical protein
MSFPFSISHTAMKPPSSAETTVSNCPLFRANATGNSWEVLISSYVLKNHRFIFLDPNKMLFVY